MTPVSSDAMSLPEQRLETQSRDQPKIKKQEVLEDYKVMKDTAQTKQKNYIK